MRIKDIESVIQRIVPGALAQSWDNVGLLVGDRKSQVKNVLLTIDITKAVCIEAAKLKTDLIISYHPIIWDGLKSVTADGPGSVVYELIKHGIAVFSIHTALDAMIGGVNDGLADMMGIANRRALGDWVENPASDNYKLVVFVPVESLAKVSNAVFAAGAGAIGNYSHCGFAAKGEGSFLPLEGAKPAIGKRGKLEKVAEVRFEAIVPTDKLSAVVAAMRNAHPYEMPAFDCFRVYNPENRFGLGRIGELAEPLPISAIIRRIKRQTGAKAFGIVGDDKKVVKKAAVCAGSCGKIINLVIAAGCDLYLTGELKHHQALAAQEAGLTCICLSHTVSERFILKKLAKQLQKELGDVNIRISRQDADPFVWKRL